MLLKPTLVRLAAAIVLALVAIVRPVAAGPYETALDRLAADSFPDTATAIEELAKSGDERAVGVLEAMVDRRLMFAGGLVAIADAAGKLTDARTGKAIDGRPDLAPVRINNRLRGLIQGSLGSLTLLAPAPARRLAAAEALLRSKDEASLPALEAALAKETDPGVKAVMAAARGAIQLARKDATLADRLGAIDALARRGGQDMMGLLRAAAKDLAEPEARAAAESAVRKLEDHQRLIGVAQNVWYGLSLGSVLLLVAIGLAITFGVMGVINMAHGEMVMLGAYTTFAVQEGFRAHAPGLLDWSLAVAVPLAFVVTGLVGIAIERGIIRFLYGRPLETLLATSGISLFLQQLVRTVFGSSNREVSSPSFMSGSIEVMGLQVTLGRAWIIVFTLVLFVALLAVLKRTPLGLQMRAVTQNRRMAAAMGIPTPRIDALTFGLGSGIAGIAGVALSQIDNVSPNLGQSYIVDSFMVVVFGGVGNLWGTLVSAFALGLANKFVEPLAGAVLAKILILVLLILFIQKRPRGLFALKGRAVEA